MRVLVQIRTDKKLKINVVEQPKFEIHGNGGKAVGMRAVFRIPGIAEEIGLELEMACVHGVGALGLVWPIGAHLAHESAWCRPKKGVSRFVWRDFVRANGEGEKGGSENTFKIHAGQSGRFDV